MGKGLEVIIVGGGIAGLAAAIAIRPICNKITILEKSQMLRESGALISLQPNASKILASWGIDKFLDNFGPMADRSFRILTQDGQLVREVDLGNSMSQFGAERMLYHRQDLHTALLEAATSGELLGCAAQIQTNCSVASCLPELAEVTLSNGSKLSADIIIGADGIHSIMRSVVVGEPRPALRTGLSAYRMLIPTDGLKDIDVPKEVFDPAQPATTMIVGQDRRVIMGPGRNGRVYGIVALIPDEETDHCPNGDSWVSEGSLDEVLKRYSDFPPWLLDMFKRAPDTALWQLRDIDPLPNWVRGRTILIGDAAHAMLPTQGQGASQSFEDAEALYAFLSDLPDAPSAAMVGEALLKVFDSRYERVSLIQAYSRQQAQSGTDSQTELVSLNPAQFMQYNCKYDGAKDWVARAASKETVLVAP